MATPTTQSRETRLWLIRHGETAWSADGRHTGRTDVPLTSTGQRQARALAASLVGVSFTRVLTSPLQRAAETCRLAGYGDRAEGCEALMEWDYGDYEGLTTDQVRETRPDWLIWSGAVPGGETLGHVAERADRVIDALVDCAGDIALFAHGHLLRILAARWLGLPPDHGRLFILDAGSISRLGHEHHLRAIAAWNQAPAV
ncbi:MAG: histidine phosphatase family protein [Chromatiales bacterium 21-64-14]|nr:MAG: histidine phosphatase family protein [Chromatiales bacterium 21-64-14]HQU16558.1 histidine phosphatase family protein [Gammaproteobacteria bacterium]